MSDYTKLVFSSCGCLKTNIAIRYLGYTERFQEKLRDNPTIIP